MERCDFLDVSRVKVRGEGSEKGRQSSVVICKCI